MPMRRPGAFSLILSAVLTSMSISHAYAMSDNLRNQMARAPVCFFVYLVPSATHSALSFEESNGTHLGIVPFDSESVSQIWSIRPSSDTRSATISPLMNANLFLSQAADGLAVSRLRSDVPFFPNWLFSLFVSTQQAFAGIQQYQTHHFLDLEDNRRHYLLRKDSQGLKGWMILDATTGKSCVSLLSSRYPQQTLDTAKECAVVQLQTPSGEVLRCPAPMVNESTNTLSDRFTFPSLGPADTASVFHVDSLVSDRGDVLLSLRNSYVHSVLTVFQHPSSSILQCVPLPSSADHLPFMFFLDIPRLGRGGLRLYSRYGDPIVYDESSKQVWIDSRLSMRDKEWRILAYPSGEDCAPFFHRMAQDKNRAGYIRPLFFSSPIHIASSSSVYSTHKSHFYFGPFSDVKNTAIFALSPYDLESFGHHKVLRLKTGECILPRLGTRDYDANRVLMIGSCDAKAAHQWSYGAFDRQVPEQMQFCIDGLLSASNVPMCLGISHTSNIFLTPQRDREGHITPASLMVFSPVQNTQAVIPVFLSLEGECLGVANKKVGEGIQRQPCDDAHYDKRFYEVLPFQEDGHQDAMSFFMLKVYDWHLLPSGAWNSDSYCLGVDDHVPRLHNCSQSGDLLWHRQGEQLCFDEECLHADGFDLSSVHLLAQGSGTLFSRAVDVTSLHTISDHVFFRVQNVEHHLCMRAPVILGQPFFMAPCYPHLSSYNDLYELFSLSPLDAELAIKTGNGLRVFSYGFDPDTAAAALLFSVQHAKRKHSYPVFFDEQGHMYLHSHMMTLSPKPVFAAEEGRHKRHASANNLIKHYVLIQDNSQETHWLFVPYLADQYVFQ